MHKWTKADDDVIRQHYPNGGANTCKRYLQASTNAISIRARRLGLKAANVVYHRQPLKDYSGQRFGRLIAMRRFIAELKYHGKQVVWYECVCDCGRPKNVRFTSLISGGTRSCGCLNVEKARLVIPAATIKAANIKRLSADDAINTRCYGIYTRNAIKHNREWSLDISTFSKLIRQNCWYCGSAPRHMSFDKRHTRSVLTNGIDRIDNNKGYVLDNVRTCCAICNRAKYVLSEIEFMEWIHQLVQHVKAGTHTELGA